MNRLWTLLAAAILAIAALAPLDAHAAKAMCRVCVVAHGESEEEEVVATRTHQGREYGFCSQTCAEAFDADPAAYVLPELPRPAPAFSVTGLDGRPVTRESLRGRVVLLDFWATWCAPCRKSMPELQALHDRYRARGFTVLGVSIDEGGPAKVKKFVRGKYTYPIAMDSETAPAWEAYRVKAVPAAFLIDRDGRIVAQWTGRFAAAELEQKLAALLTTD